MSITHGGNKTASAGVNLAFGDGTFINDKLDRDCTGIGKLAYHPRDVARSLI